jgi:phosphoserine phosphatase RsbU/P
LATQIQSRLLPARDIKTKDWATRYRYEPASVVGGDYCEVVAAADGSSLFFALGDVAGKGVAASLLMTHLRAIFRSLLSLELPLTEMMSRANRLCSEVIRIRTMRRWWRAALPIIANAAPAGRNRAH